MGKNKEKYICSNCGYTVSKWLGKCPECGTWGSFEKAIDFKKDKNSFSISADNEKPVPISKILISDNIRLKTHINEVDMVLGGGIVPGELILIGGEPGIGKSTLMLQLANSIAQKNYKVLYVSGEESLTQIKLRAERLNTLSPNIFLLSENNIERIIFSANDISPQIIIFDSIQTLYDANIQSAPGTISQIRECTVKILQYAKTNKISAFIVGHVTKEGIVAGPKVLEHIVDAVLYFEGDKNNEIRILRAVKNRFGTTNEIGLLEMTSFGLKELSDFNFFSIHKGKETPSGCAFSAIIEGSRSIIVEIQGLTNYNGGFGIPKRMTSGIDNRKASLVIAVLEKYMGMKLYSYDIYLKTIGGMKIEEPAVDLAIAFAIWSSFYNISLPYKAAFIGEIGLNGELLPVSWAEKRIKELVKLGFEKIYISANTKIDNFVNCELCCINNIKEFFEFFKH